MRRAHRLSLASLVCLASVAHAVAQPLTIEQPKEAGMVAFPYGEPQIFAARSATAQRAAQLDR